MHVLNYLGEDIMANKKKIEANIDKILEVLADIYPDAYCELNHQTPFELLVATILSAQATDKKVNEVTAGLFTRYNEPEHFANLSIAELEDEIRQIGLYRTKSKNLIATAQILLDQHGGQVPSSREALEALPGVGRKTANVVLSTAFHVPAIAVDTHVFRVANRLGLAQSDNVKLTEEQLMERIPIDLWTATHHRLIWHGRRVCFARKPACGTCELLMYCLEGPNFL